MDASFLILLQYPPSHQLLRRISARLDPEIEVIEEIEGLRGPLEPFAKAQARGSAEGQRKDQADWRRRRKIEHEQATMSIGLYQVEELVI